MEILFSNIEDVEETTEPADAPQPEPELEPEPEPEVEEEPPAPKGTPTGAGRPSVLKVSARSRPSAVAGAIAGVIRECGRAEVQSIGAGATNQAVKAVAIARSYLEEEGVDIVCVPSFVEVMIDREERTAMRLVVERRD